MDKTAVVQVRTTKDTKENAVRVLDSLGMKLSEYVNLALNQLIIQKAVPFPITSQKNPYLPQEAIDEVGASLRMEGLPLTEEDLSLLKLIKSGNIDTEQVRQNYSYKNDRELLEEAYIQKMKDRGLWEGQ